MVFDLTQYMVVLSRDPENFTVPTKVYTEEGEANAAARLATDLAGAPKAGMLPSHVGYRVAGFAEALTVLLERACDKAVARAQCAEEPY